MAMMHRFRPTVPSSKLLPDFRFVRTLQSPDHIVYDKAISKYRISSKAFGPSSSDKSLSGDLEQLLVEDGLTATSLYPAVSRAVGAASLTIAQIRDAGLIIDHDPVPENWYHGAVTGFKGKVKDKLRLAAVELIEIDQAEAARRDPH